MIECREGYSPCQADAQNQNYNIRIPFSIAWSYLFLILSFHSASYQTYRQQISAPSWVRNVHLLVSASNDEQTLLLLVVPSLLINGISQALGECDKKMPIDAQLGWKLPLLQNLRLWFQCQIVLTRQNCIPRILQWVFLNHERFGCIGSVRIYLHCNQRLNLIRVPLYIIGVVREKTNMRLWAFVSEGTGNPRRGRSHSGSGRISPF